MRSAISVDVRAPADLFFQIVRHVERWPRLLPHYARVRVLERGADGAVVAELVARRPVFELLGIGIPVAWRSRATVDASERSLRFHHLGGATAGMDVQWSIESTPSGCTVTIEHEFRRRLPVPLLGLMLGDAVWPLLVDRLFTRPIAGRTLASFAAIAESLAPDPESDVSIQANPST